MKTQAHKPSYLPLLIASVAVILFSTAGMARMMGWGTSSTDGSGGILALDPTDAVPTSDARAKHRCPECGVIVSMREIERHDEDTGPGAAGGVAGNRDETRVRPARSYEFIVRMADGSRRVIGEANPESWRPGEPVILIGGANPSNR